MPPKTYTNCGQAMYSTIETTTLERIRYGLEARLSLNDEYARVNVASEMMAAQLVARVELEFFGEETPPRVIEHPATWWDAFKEVHFPAWLRRRFPVRYRQHVVSLALLWPDFRPSMPHERVVYLPKQSTTDFADDPELWGVGSDTYMPRGTGPYPDWLPDA